MAEQQFYTLITNVGQAKLANATALGTKVSFAKLQVGDGKDYNPTENQENLNHKVWEGNINSITTDSKNPNWIVIQTLIPASVGGFNINEVGVFDDEGNMLIVSKYPETYKPKLENGSGKDLTIKLIIQVSNTESVTLKIDPSITIATKEDIKNVEKQIENIKVPVQSVNGKTGKVILKAEDITAKDGTNLEKFKKQVNTQYEDLANFKNSIKNCEFNSNNTGVEDRNKWQQIGYTLITHQYEDVVVILNAIGYSNNNIESTYGKILLRVKQQEKMGKPPMTNLELLDSSNFKRENFKAILTTNTDKETVVQLWMLDKNFNDRIKFKTDIQNNANNFVFKNSDFAQKLPSGTEINCELGGNAKRINDIEQALIEKGFDIAKNKLNI